MYFNNQWCGTSYSFQTRSVSPQKPSLLNKTNIHCRNKLKYIQFTPILCSFHLSSNSAGVCKKHVKYKTMNITEYLHNTAVEVLVHSHQQLTRESLRKSWLRERGERWWRHGEAVSRQCWKHWLSDVQSMDGRKQSWQDRVEWERWCSVHCHSPRTPQLHVNSYCQNMWYVIVLSIFCGDIWFKEILL